MANEELLAYIRQSLAMGVAKADIEKALLTAGWPTQDVTGAFAAIEQPMAAVVSMVAPPVITPQPLAPVDENAAETARIQHELEVEVKRRKWHGATTSTPGVGGIIGWLIAKKLAHDEVQANLMLLGVAFIAVALTVWINWPQTKSNAPTSAQMEASIKAMQNIQP